MVRQRTQRERIRAYLEDGNSITPIGALNNFGCFRLAAVIHLLRHDSGLNIHTINVTQDGKTYAKYVLARFNQNGEHGRNIF